VLDILPDLGDEAIRRDLRYPFLGMVLYLDGLCFGSGVGILGVVRVFASACC
jgi:hypothetical protein